MKDLTLAARTRDTHGTSDLLVSGYLSVRSEAILSPFFQLKHFPVIDGLLNGRLLQQQTGRDIPISEIMKAIVTRVEESQIYSYAIGVHLYYVDEIGQNVLADSTVTPSLVGFTDVDSIRTLLTTAIIADAVTYGYTITANDILWGLLSAPAARSFSNPSLAVNTARRASTTRDVFVSASVDITASLSLTTGQKGTMTLQYADDSAFTTNVKTAQASVNGNTGTLTVGLALGQIVSASVSGFIPANKYYRLLTTNNTGTPTYGTPAIQEVLL
jgi:hypothetical protein